MSKQVADPWAVKRWYRCSKCNVTTETTRYRMNRIHKEEHGCSVWAVNDPTRDEAILLHPSGWGTVKENLWHMRRKLTNGGAGCCGTHGFTETADIPPEGAEICKNCLKHAREDIKNAGVEWKPRERNTTYAPTAVFKQPKKFHVDCFELGKLVDSRGFDGKAKAREWAKEWVGHHYTHATVMDESGNSLGRYQWPEGWIES